MIINKEQKSKLIKQFAKSDKDVGSTEVQLALITDRISTISAHVKSFPKDKHSRVGLLKLVGKKRKLAKYLERKDKAGFAKVMQQLKTL